MGRSVENGIHTTQGKGKGDVHDPAERTVHERSPHDGPRKHDRRILDLFRHVDGRVGADEGVNRSEKPNHKGQAIGLPLSQVEELGEDLLGVAARGQNPQRDQDGEETKQVEDEDHALDHGEPLCQEGVEDDAEGDDGNDEQGAVPVFEDIIGVVEDDQALDHGSHQEGERCQTDLPSQNRHPACKPLPSDCLVHE